MTGALLVSTALVFSCSCGCGDHGTVPSVIVHSTLFSCTILFTTRFTTVQLHHSVQRHHALDSPCPPPALPIMQTRSTSRASSCRRASCITCSPSCRQGAAVVVLCKSCVSGGVTEQQVHAHVSHMSQVNPPCQQSCSKLYPAASSNCRAMRSRRRCGTWRRRGPPPTPTTRPSCSSEWVGWGGRHGVQAWVRGLPSADAQQSA